MKKITNILKVLMFLLIATILFAPAGEVRAKSNTITVTLKSDDDIDEAVKTVHSNALKHKKMVLKIKGNKKKSRKTLEKFEKQLQLYNTYSVIINVDEGKTKKGYTSYTITKDYAYIYDYANKIIAYSVKVRHYNYDLKADPNRLENYTHFISYNTPDPDSFIKYKNHKDWDKYYNEPVNSTETWGSAMGIPENWKDYLPDWQMFEEGKTYAQLSTFQQMQMLYFHFNSSFVEDRDHSMRMPIKTQLKRILDKKARGVCDEVRYYYRAIALQLDIPTVRAKSSTHGWLYVYVDDPNAEAGWYLVNNGNFEEGLYDTCIYNSLPGYDGSNCNRKPGNERPIENVGNGEPDNGKLEDKLSKKHTYLH